MASEKISSWLIAVRSLALVDAAGPLLAQLAAVLTQVADQLAQELGAAVGALGHRGSSARRRSGTPPTLQPSGAPRDQREPSGPQLGEQVLRHPPGGGAGRRREAGRQRAAGHEHEGVRGPMLRVAARSVAGAPRRRPGRARPPRAGGPPPMSSPSASPSASQVIRASSGLSEARPATRRRRPAARSGSARPAGSASRRRGLRAGGHLVRLGGPGRQAIVAARTPLRDRHTRARAVGGAAAGAALQSSNQGPAAGDVACQRVMVTVVPRPGSESIANSSIRRRAPGSPRPMLPVVDQPSVIAAWCRPCRARCRPPVRRCPRDRPRRDAPALSARGRE